MEILLVVMEGFALLEDVVHLLLSVVELPLEVSPLLLDLIDLVLDRRSGPAAGVLFVEDVPCSILQVVQLSFVVVKLILQNLN